MSIFNSKIRTLASILLVLLTFYLTILISIYNFFDESQTRSFLQLFLSILPFSLIIMNPNKNNTEAKN